MRVLFTCIPVSGHFHPLVPFARALADAGHDVAFASPAYVTPIVAAVESMGFQHFPAGLERPVAEIYPQLQTMSGPERADFTLRVLVADLWPRHLVPDLFALAATWSPDLIINAELSYGGCIAAERLSLPHAVVDIAAAGEPLWVRECIVEPLNRHRVANGLAPDPDLVMLHRYLTLHPFPPTFRNPAFPLAPTTHFLRPTPDDQSGAEVLPEWVAALPDRPIVYVGLGTLHNRPEVFRAIIAGLRDETLTLIVTVGRNQDPAEYGPQPENVHIERYIPLSLLLSHCDAAVTHGGSGTLMAAFGQGLPVVVMPMAADQPENAARCAALGLGRVVTPAELTPESAREAALGVLNDPSYRASAARLRDEMATLPGPEYAVQLLERLAVEKQPISAA